jgi:hypothetical protein
MYNTKDNTNAMEDVLVFRLIQLLCVWLNHRNFLHPRHIEIMNETQ